MHQVSPEVQMTVLVSVIFRVLPAQPGLGVSPAPRAADSTAHCQNLAWSKFKLVLLQTVLPVHEGIFNKLCISLI